MKISIIGILAALAMSSLTTYSHADCSSQTGPKGSYDACTRNPR